jgi:hypothetical protein
MNKIHRPHKESGYIAKVDYQDTVDGDGKPDWIMLYQPGPKARATPRNPIPKLGNAAANCTTTSAKDQPEGSEKFRCCTLADAHGNSLSDRN